MALELCESLYNWQAMYCQVCKKRYSNQGVAGGYWKGWNKVCKRCSIDL